MTFPQVLAELTTIAQAWRTQEAEATDEGRHAVARDCRLRASAIEWAIEALAKKEKEQ